MKKLKLDQITIDAGTQTRITMNEETITDYAEAMTEGAKFPAVVVFASGTEYLLADGFHRFMAAQRCGWREIETDVRKGSRLDAIKYSLGANNGHGLRRTNADKRWCVEIALKEFGGMTNEVIAKMCGVSAVMVAAVSSTSKILRPDKRTGQDGKKYPAQRELAGDDEHREKGGQFETKKEKWEIGPPLNGMQFARMAIMDLEQIRPDDKERTEAFNTVKEWIKDNEN
jgi:hypothetical protein